MSILKEDMVSLIAERTGYTKASSRFFLEVTLDILKEQVNMGHRIKFPRYFTIQMVRTEPRMRYDVYRDERKLCKPRKRIVFTPSPQFIEED